MLGHAYFHAAQHDLAITNLKAIEDPLAWELVGLAYNQAIIGDVEHYTTAERYRASVQLTLAIIGLLLGFRLAFDATWAARVQPLFAAMVAPSAYLGFCALTQDDKPKWRKTLLSTGLPVVMAQAATLANLSISADVFVLGITSVYLFRIARLLPCTPMTSCTLPCMHWVY